MPLVIVDLSVEYVTCRNGDSPVLLTFVRNFPGELHVGDHVELHDDRLHVVGREPKAPGLRDFWTRENLRDFDRLCDQYADEVGIPVDRRTEAFRYAVADGIAENPVFIAREVRKRLAEWLERDIVGYAQEIHPQG